MDKRTATTPTHDLNCVLELVATKLRNGSLNSDFKNALRTDKERIQFVNAELKAATLILALRRRDRHRGRK